MTGLTDSGIYFLVKRIMTVLMGLTRRSEMHAAEGELADQVKGRYVSNDQSVSPCLSREMKLD